MSDMKAQQVWDNLPDIDSFKMFYAENMGRNLTYAAYQDAIVKYAD
jgi:hypothetical protein